MPKHLQAALEDQEADKGSEDFITQYLEYGTVLGLAARQATEDIGGILGRIFDYFSTVNRTADFE